MTVGNWRSFRSQPPREARGGIKASSRRGDFAESWWGKRWIEVLESFPIGARLSRGKACARRGQVLSLEVRGGTVEAQVQGSRVKPYRCHIDIAPYDEETWRRILGVVGAHAYLAAALLGGRVPPELEEALEREDLPLFPVEEDRIAMSCSCPDWSVPCKHLAAVFYLLGERMDGDPFLLFELQGLSREELLLQVGVEVASLGRPPPCPLFRGGTASEIPPPCSARWGPFPSGEAKNPWRRPSSPCTAPSGKNIAEGCDPTP